MKRLLTVPTAMLAMLALATPAAAQSITLEPIEVNGQPAEGDVAVTNGNRVVFAASVADVDTSPTLTFRFSQWAYVLNSAVGGQCGEPTEVSAGMYELECSVTILTGGAPGSGTLQVEFEVTDTSDQPCATSDDTVTLIVMASDVGEATATLTLCAAEQAQPMEPTPAASVLPDAAMTNETASASHAVIVAALAMLAIGSFGVYVSARDRR